MHREVPVKVTAWVDEGVAGLVTALSALPGVITLDSCQERPDGLASVMFCTHDPVELPGIVAQLGRAIGSGTVPPGGVTLSLWWGSDDAQAVADLTCPPELVPGMSRLVRCLAGISTIDELAGRVG